MPAQQKELPSPSETRLVSLVLPVFRNEGELHRTYHKLREILIRDLPRYRYEFIFIEDGSDDNSLDELLEIQESDECVSIIKLSRNFGQFAAINAGIRRARGDLVMVISADLQDPPELLARFVQAYEQGFEVMIAERIRRNDTILTNLTSRIYFGLLRISNPRVPKGGFDCFMLTRKTADAYRQLDDRIRIHHVDIPWLGFKVTYIPYERLARTVGKSQYTFNKRFVGGLNGILNSSVWPIRLISLAGISISSLGFIYAAMIVHAYFFRSLPFTGYAPIMITLLILCGVIIFMLGIIGEYLWRAYYETKRRPLYLIDEIYESRTDKNPET